jgi:Zn-dependent M28 family amino/carboxypeptidase
VRAAAVAAGGLVVALGLPATAGAAPSNTACETRVNDTYDKLLECVTLEGVREHQAALQQIADESEDPVYPGSRAAGTEGYQAGVDYVAGLLEDAGYDVSFPSVDFPFEFPAELRQLAPEPAADYVTDTFRGSGSGTVEGPVVPVDLAVEDPAASTSGCEAADFAGLDFSGAQDIALLQRGTCTFGLKAENADKAGAEAVVIMNQGNGADRSGPYTGDGTVRNPDGTGTVEYDIPSVSAPFADGVALSRSGSTAFVRVIEPENRTDVSVIAEKVGENPDNVVMAGAHLDSVEVGPGINDNGSGSAALLETALMMADVETPNTIRFAWWGAEELGLLGSSAYVAGLPEAERTRIALYMNYDMVGSPNGFLGVYDSDESTFTAPVEVPKGSTAIEDVYESFYTSVGRPYDDSEFSGRSDYQAFIASGIPAGGLFTGAEVLKTEQQAGIWGGTAGEAFDQCYHQACDTFENTDVGLLEVNSDLIAYSMLHFAFSTEAVNGVPGESVPGQPLPAPAGPEGTFAQGGGGLAHDHDHGPSA